MNGNFYTRMILHIMSWKFTVSLTLPPLPLSFSRYPSLQNLNSVISQDTMKHRKKRKLTGKADKISSEIASHDDDNEALIDN